jgi:hypothetical protein
MQSVPLRFIPEANPPVVYIADAYGVVQSVAHPRLSGDTVHGTSVGDNQPVAVPLNEVQRLSTVRLNRGRTALLVGGLSAAAGLMVYTVLAHTGKEIAFFCDYNNPNPNTSPDAPQCAFPTN